jgi:hypothetical protein
VEFDSRFLASHTVGGQIWSCDQPEVFDLLENRFHYFLFLKRFGARGDDAHAREREKTRAY